MIRRAVFLDRDGTMIEDVGHLDTHQRIDERLAAGGARVDAYYYCPHHPDGSVAASARTCACREPGRGLVDKAANAVVDNLAAATAWISTTDNSELSSLS